MMTGSLKIFGVAAVITEEGLNVALHSLEASMHMRFFPTSIAPSFLVPVKVALASIRNPLTLSFLLNYPDDIMRLDLKVYKTITTYGSIASSGGESSRSW